jgi:CheY-like chemotaxis protein
MQDLIDRFLRRHARRIVAASTLDEARQRLTELDAIDLVLLDLDIENHGGLSLLEDISSADTPNRPAVVAVAGRANLDCEARASLLGAIGFVSKPVSLAKLSAVLRSRNRPFEPAAPRMRARPIAEVILLDAEQGTHVAQWEVQDISVSGAFVRSHVTYTPGTILALELQLGITRFSVSARVVRTQSSEWIANAGVGVRFELDPTTRSGIQDALAQLAPLVQVDESYDTRPPR